ncbi:MAG: response regulator [Pyrinomonadaceae bacterium]|nr:response regulator [Pyrinomonadaceae bacterium]
MLDQAQFLKSEQGALEEAAFASSDATTTASPQTQGVERTARRVLLFARSDVASIRPKFPTLDAGYEMISVSLMEAFDVIAASLPDVALIELQRGETNESEAINLARRLRSDPATYAVPLVFLFHKDHPALRDLSLRAGADDYFSIQTLPNEMRARLAALLWRAEAGRRVAAATQTGDRRLEIDNLIFLIDWVHESAKTSNGLDTITLIEVTTQTGNTDQATRDRTTAAAYGFLKLHLRRMDSVTFYGPTTLLIYLPGTNTDDAQALLTRLRDEFLAQRPESVVRIAMESFPANGNDIERLIEDTEIALTKRRTRESQSHVVMNATNEQSAETKAVNHERVLSSILPLCGEENNHHKMATRFADQVVEREAAQKTSEGRANGDSATPGRLLLAVSDPVRLARVNSLVQSVGYEVRPAFDGQQALDLLRIERPHLLLIDYRLRDMNGVEALRRLRQQSGGVFKLPIVLMLEAEEENVRNEVLALGAQVVVTPPDDPAQLLASVRATEHLS